MNQKAHTACNFNGLTETEGRLKVTGSHVHGESGDAQYRDAVTTDHKQELNISNSGYSDDLE